jgi:hypothetical protein
MVDKMLSTDCCLEGSLLGGRLLATHLVATGKLGPAAPNGEFAEAARAAGRRKRALELPTVRGEKVPDFGSKKLFTFILHP